MAQKATKDEKQKTQRLELNTSNRRRRLHVPDITPGSIQETNQAEASTVEGAVSLTFFNPIIIKIVLDEMNKNKQVKYLKKLHKEVKKRDNLSNTTTEVNIVMQKRAKKGKPGVGKEKLVPEKTITKTVTRKASQRVNNKRIFKDFSKEPQDFSENEFRRFIGVLLYMGDKTIIKAKELWKRTEEDADNIVITAFGRDRFMLMYSCFHFKDDTIVKLEENIENILEDIWNPASIAVVDESMIPCTSRRNPHHVFIIRKPNPNGLKVRYHIE